MKKQNSVSNRTTIRSKDYKSGTFTIVPLSILHNPNLSNEAKMLLIQVLSDSDEFTFSPTLYAKRMNVCKATIHNKIKELEEQGFAKLTRISNEVAISGRKKKGSNKVLYHYTFSEFGNLNMEKKDTEKPPKQISENQAQKAVEMPEEIIKKLDDYLASLEDYWEDDRVKSKIKELAVGITTDEELKAVIKQIDKLVVTIKKEILGLIESDIMVIKKDTISQSKYKEFRNEMKNLLFDSNRIPDWEKLSTRWFHYRNRNKPKKHVDFETKEFDRLEQEWEDNH